MVSLQNVLLLGEEKFHSIIYRGSGGATLGRARTNDLAGRSNANDLAERLKKVINFVEETIASDDLALGF